MKIRLSDSPTVRRSERPTGAASGWKCSWASLVVQEVPCYLNRFCQPEGILKNNRKRLLCTGRSAGWDTAQGKEASREGCRYIVASLGDLFMMCNVLHQRDSI